MTFIACRYEGGLRCQALHEPSATELVTDAPPDNQGRGECFSPTDLVATALATCILTIMGITAERHGWPLEGATARVEKSMTTTGARRIEKLEVWIHLPADLEEASRVVLRRAAETCPVKRSLQGSVAMEIHWS